MSWDTTIGDMTLKFGALEMADEMGYGDDVGLTRYEQDQIVASRILPARQKYRQDYVNYGSQAILGGMEYSGIAGKMTNMALGGLVAAGQSGVIEAGMRSDEVLMNERATYMDLINSRDSTINSANMQEKELAQMREMNKRDTWDYVLGLGSIVTGLLS